ncbi:MAG TPA: hypothetical protein VMS92_18045, partial [Mycobacterium sp.]|nr:hypothetical protein [Mycobacterium sp.]
MITADRALRANDAVAGGLAASSRRLRADPLPVEAPPALLIYFSPDSLAFPIMIGVRARPRCPRRETFSLYCSLLAGKTFPPD